MTDARLTFDAPLPMVVAALLAAVAAGVAWRRGLALPKPAIPLAAAGLALLVLAAGLPHWRRSVAADVAVLVDLSPSTRTAGFRDRAAVQQRIKQLLGDTPYRVYRFADGQPVADDESAWTELPAPATTFTPPAADAVVLFSDGRFDLPSSSPPVYAVIDAALSRARDGRVASLALDGPDAVAAVAVDMPRTLTWAQVLPGDRTTKPGPVVALSPGRVVLRRAIDGAPGVAGTNRAPTPALTLATTARLSPGDDWPENDALTIAPPPPDRTERWFVGDPGSPAAPPGYRLVPPSALATDAAAYLSTSVIVLDNVPASAISDAARTRLAQFVRDLGGGLVLVGGDQAFAAGGHVGTTIDAISPLASAPPRPTTEWILLTDGSGSMNSGTGTGPGGDAGRTRWQSATAALVRLLPSLPPEDPVSLGHFAAEANWWIEGRPAREARSLALPPAGVSPGGPTNLRPAIEAAARRHDPALPAQLLLLSDADADIGDVGTLAELLKSRNIMLHLLAVGEGKGLADLQRVAAATGGSVVRQADADRWADAAAELLKSAGDDHLSLEAVDVRFIDGLSALPARRVPAWNRTWLRPRATPLAEATRSGLNAGADATPIAARWQVGEGSVAAIAFAARAAESDALASLVAAPPRDPRLNVSVTPGGRLRIRVDAIHGASATVAADRTPAGRYLNGLALMLELLPADAVPVAPGDTVRLSQRSQSIPQTGPGRYELEVDAPTRPMLATLTLDGRPFDRFAVAGRYPREFDAIGIDRAGLDRCIERFGGAVIEADQARPIDLRRPLRTTPFAAWLLAAGAALVLSAMLWGRRV